MNNLTNDSEYENNLMLWTLFLRKAMGSDPVWLQVTISTILLSIFVVGLIGNLLTCIVIYNDRSMHTATNFYLFNMAVSDSVVSFAIFLEVYLFLAESYLFGNIACKIHFFFVIFLWNNSTLVMTALAIERYVAIWYPLMLKSSPPLKRVMKVITIIWIIAILETTPEVLTVELIRTNHMSVCFTVPSPAARVVNGVLALVTFVVPLGIILFVYIMIALKVNTTEKSNSNRKIFNHRDNRSKVNKLTAMTLSFLICWLPFFTFRILIFSLDMRQLMQLDQLWSIGYKTVLINSWFSIVLNPILFSLMSTKFRKALKMLCNRKILIQHEITAV
ncbi:jg12988 [Pararge aegeria aegeria]|uniref:Jg12988 protein n=1 Tax=Pararge aegeria aegeria TaxID=348720 RepID=A0A8S4QNZ0_9NEOP|nr:jg12988 [Pararge aegeria aegeria]